LFIIVTDYIKSRGASVWIRLCGETEARFFQRKFVNAGVPQKKKKEITSFSRLLSSDFLRRFEETHHDFS